MTGYFHFTATGKQIIIFCKYMIGPVAFSGRETHVQILIRIVLDMCTGSDKEPVLAAVVAAYSSHQHQFIVQIESILNVCPRNRFFYECVC